MFDCYLKYESGIEKCYIKWNLARKSEMLEKYCEQVIKQKKAESKLYSKKRYWSYI